MLVETKAYVAAEFKIESNCSTEVDTESYGWIEV
jgi:hypothetical protein